MAKNIATIEIAIEQNGTATKMVRADLSVEGKNAYTVSILKPDGSKDKSTINSDSDSPATAWLLQKLKTLVDGFDPNTATVKVVSDPLNLLPKVTYRCPNPRCQAKLFESWG